MSFTAQGWGRDAVPPPPRPVAARCEPLGVRHCDVDGSVFGRLGRSCELGTAPAARHQWYVPRSSVKAPLYLRDPRKGCDDTRLRRNADDVVLPNKAVVSLSSSAAVRSISAINASLTLTANAKLYAAAGYTSSDGILTLAPDAAITSGSTMVLSRGYVEGFPSIDTEVASATLLTTRRLVYLNSGSLTATVSLNATVRFRSKVCYAHTAHALQSNLHTAYCYG